MSDYVMYFPEVFASPVVEKAFAVGIGFALLIVIISFMGITVFLFIESLIKKFKR